MRHDRFWWDFVGKVGAPLFAATVVGCLMSGEFMLLHAGLMITGLGAMAASHWHEHH